MATKYNSEVVSMDTPTTIFIKLQDGDGKDIATLTANHRDFKSGRDGFGYYGKVEIAGLRHQCSLNIVKIKGQENPVTASPVKITQGKPRKNPVTGK
jgi:hypothetical protein